MIVKKPFTKSRWFHRHAELIVFGIFFLIITVFFVIRFVTLPEIRYSSQSFGAEPDSYLYIKDGDSIRYSFYPSKKHIDSISLNGFLFESDSFVKDEGLVLQVYDESGDLLGESACDLFYQHTDNKSLIFEFDTITGLDSSSRLTLQITTRNMPTSGIRIGIRNFPPHSHGMKPMQFNDEDISSTLCTTLYARTSSRNMSHIGIYLIELLSGVCILLFSLKKKIIFHKKEDVRPFDAGELTKQQRKRVSRPFIGAVILLVIYLLFMSEYAYGTFSETHKLSADEYEAESVVAYTNSEKLVFQNSESELKQYVVIPKGTVSGIQLHFRPLEMCRFKVYYSLTDQNGKVLKEGRYHVNAMREETWDNSEQDILFSSPLQLTEDTPCTLNLTFDNPTGTPISIGLCHANTPLEYGSDASTGRKLVEYYYYLDVEYDRSLVTILNPELIKPHLITERTPCSLDLNQLTHSQVPLLRQGSSYRLASMFDISLNTDVALSVAALYQTQNTAISFVFYQLLIFCVLFIITTLLYLTTRTSPKGNAIMLLWGVISLGLVFSLLIPPGCVPDERTHLDSVYDFVNKIFYRSYSKNPHILYRRLTDIDPNAATTMDVSYDLYAKIHTGLFRSAGDSTLLPSYISHSAESNAPIFCYLPQIFGMLLSRIFGFNNTTLLLFTRWVTLICTALLSYLGIRKMPYGKTVMGLVLLLPISLQQMASFSYDSMIIATVYVFIGYLMSYVSDGFEKKYDPYILVLSGILLGQIKSGVYIPVLLIAVIAFTRVASIRKRQGIKKGLSFMIPVLPALFVLLYRYSSLILTILNRDVANNSSGAASDSAPFFSIGYAVQHKRETVRLLEKTFFYQNDFYIRSMLTGYLGRLNINIPIIIMIAFLIILLIAIFSKEKALDEKVFSLKERILFLVACSITYVFILASMLLTWTKVGATIIDGVQGRYFLPVLGLFLLTFKGNKICFKKDYSRYLLYAAYYLNLLTFCYIITAV